MSGTQTRRIGALVDVYPQPLVEIHPRLAEKYGIATRDWVTVKTRRDSVTLQANVVKTHPAPTPSSSLITGPTSAARTN